MSTEHADHTDGTAEMAETSPSPEPSATAATATAVGAADDPDDPGATEAPEPRITRKTWLLLVAVIVAVQAAGRAWVLSGRTFYWDDFIIVGSAADADWWTPDYFLQAHDGHLAPLAFILQAVANQIAPWQWWLPAALMLLGQAAVTVAVARALRHIAGRSWQALAALALVAWTPLTLPGST